MIFNPSEYSTGPGIYMMKDENGRIIYVGKARNIRKRLGSYFRQDSALSPKTRVMMGRVRKIDSITTLSEKEALLLESSLIKKHRPRYNIVLRDDKQYVLFRLDRSQAYPALELTRKAGKDNNMYFGPFTSGLAARQTLKIINRLFLLRKCGHKKFRNRVRPCLQYYIKRCLAPCCLDIDPREYSTQVRQVDLFLSGKSRELIQKLKQNMMDAADNLDYEKAAVLRDQIRAVEETTATQSVVMPAGHDMDVFDLSQSDRGLCTGVIFVRQGRVLDSKNFFWPDYDISDSGEMEKILVSILSQFYGPDKFIPEKIVLPVKIHDESLVQVLSEYKGSRVKIMKARGENLKSLLRMARHNCLTFATRKFQPSLINIGKTLKLAKEPLRVECIDVSHQSGQNTRVGSVVFEQGEPVKSDYRLYNLPDVSPGDDYQALRKFISRRKKSKLVWPDLLLIDGGPGQLNTVIRAMEESDINGLNLAAISKGPTRSKSQLNDQVFIPGRKNPLSLKPGSPELLFLQRVRDEAHRFVIGSLRQAAGKSLKKSRLENIPGIGPKKAKALWEYFKDLDLITNAGPEELRNVPGIGPKKAKHITEAIKKWNT
ncbi:MAG: excinuclease ABC subunit UvrC [Desulfonatronovibrio sp.]